MLDFAKNKWGNSNSLSNRDLTFKLLITLALTLISRACTIHCLDIRFMTKHAHFVQFMIGRLHKGWKSGKSYPAVRCCEYDADRDLCIQTTLNVHLKRTKPWRTDQKKQLLLSYVNPHEEVCSSTISGWIMKVLNLAGIDTSVFKGHSSLSTTSSGAEHCQKYLNYT